jgi:hypothetical protein
LAELTVVLKLNQGVRQWLYIIAGVLFFGSFFCTSKRKNIKLGERQKKNLKFKFKLPVSPLKKFSSGIY